MQVIVVGDSCSGKSSVLLWLQKQGLLTLPEEGWKQIPYIEESNKARSNIWFCNYFFDRDQQYRGRSVIKERCLQYQFPFTCAQELAGKITPVEREKIIEQLNYLDRQLPLERDSVVIHFVCSSELVYERLKVRIATMTRQTPYWDILRQQTKEYFQILGRYYQIDTTSKTIPEIGADVLEILSKEHFLTD